jgi:putative aldouronate transport system substrate-binding protein
MLVDLTEMIENSKYVKAGVPQSMLDAVARDGKIYGMPFQNPGGCVGYIRQDWLDKLGLEIPTTYEEFVEVLRAFTFNDPDGDGEDNTYGYTTLVNNDFDNYSRLVMQDAVIGFRPNADGVWADGFLEPQMVDALGRLKSLYDEGIMDPTFITAKSTGESRSKLIEGKVGIWEYWAGEWGMNLDEYSKKVDPNNVIAPMPPLAGMTYKVRMPSVWTITVKAKDPQLIFDQLFESFFDKGERQTLWTYGLEGMHWVKEDGVGKFLPTKVDPTRGFKKVWVARELQLNDMEYVVPLDPRVAKSMASFKPTWQEIIPPPSDAYIKYCGDILELKKETILKIVTGEYASIEEGLKTYEEKAMKEFKLATILEELND